MWFNFAFEISQRLKPGIELKHLCFKDNDAAPFAYI